MQPSWHWLKKSSVEISGDHERLKLVCLRPNETSFQTELVIEWAYEFLLTVCSSKSFTNFHDFQEVSAGPCYYIQESWRRCDSQQFVRGPFDNHQVVRGPCDHQQVLPGPCDNQQVVRVPRDIRKRVRGLKWSRRHHFFIKLS